MSIVSSNANHALHYMKTNCQRMLKVLTLQVTADLTTCELELYNGNEYSGVLINSGCSIDHSCRRRA